MKRLLILSVILFSLAGCKKEPCYQSKGIITGFDYRKCMCCGGWFIEIEDSTWRFDQVPEGSTVNLDSVDFPFKVYLDWKEKDPKCLGDEIVVTRMVQRE